MAFWKFTKSLRSFCLEPRVLSASNFALALTQQLKWQLMRNNKNFMTGVIPFSHTTLRSTSVERSKYAGGKESLRNYNYLSLNVADFCHSSSLLLPGIIQKSRGVNINELLVISKVRSYSETSQLDTRMFSSSQSVAGSSSAGSGKKDAGKTMAEETKESQKENSASIGNNPDTKTETATANNSPSKKGMLKQAIKDYGSTVIVFHVAMSLCSLGFFYLLVSSGLDVVGLLKNLGVGESILQSKITQGASTFVIAYAVHKVFAPVRITITLTATPLIVRKLRALGILKKPIQK